MGFGDMAGAYATPMTDVTKYSNPGWLAGGLASKLGPGPVPGYNGPNFFNGPSDPNVIAMQNKLNGMQMPDTNLKPIDAYQAKDMSKTVLPQFDMARQQTTQALNAQEGSQRDSMDRKFASLGGGPGGAQIKAGMQADQAAQENRASAMNQIGQQEAQTRTGLQQQEAQKEFQSGESTKQYNANQQLQSRQLQMQNNQFQMDQGTKIAQLDLGYKSAQQQAADDQFNAAMASYSAQHSGGLLGSGGFLGTGISL